MSFSLDPSIGRPRAIYRCTDCGDEMPSDDNLRCDWCDSDREARRASPADRADWDDDPGEAKEWHDFDPEC